MISLGIDPGVVNIGMAVTDENGKLVDSRVIGFTDVASMCTAVDDAVYLLGSQGVTQTFIERFVAYKGMQSASTENILMYIGAAVYALNSECSITLLRAIDWKPALCKYLVKTSGFSNPSTKFDKKFSIAAAEFITKEKIKTTHEADAICLSYMWKIYDKV
jgi:Holliday junction resolvasome RuvABC endonuclease subunit